MSPATPGPPASGDPLPRESTAGVPRGRRPIVLGIVYLLLVVPTALAALGAAVATVMGLGGQGDLGWQGAVLVLVGLLVVATPVALVVAVILLVAGRQQGRPRLVRWGAWVPAPFLAVTAAVVAMVLLDP